MILEIESYFIQQIIKDNLIPGGEKELQQIQVDKS